MIFPQNLLEKIEVIRWELPHFFKNSNSRIYSHMLQALFFYPLSLVEANSSTFSLYLSALIFLMNSHLQFLPLSSIYSRYPLQMDHLNYLYFLFTNFPWSYISFLYYIFLVFPKYHSKFSGIFFYTHGLYFQNIYYFCVEYVKGSRG